MGELFSQHAVLGGIQDPGSRTLDRGSWILDPGFGFQDPASWILDPVSEMKDPGSWILELPGLPKGGLPPIFMDLLTFP